MTGREAGSIHTSSTVRTAAILALLMPVALLSACASLIGKPPPSMAHVHVGHALTGWPSTPDKRGLLDVAEAEAALALQTALEAGEARDPSAAKQAMRELLHIVDPGTQPVATMQALPERGGYGLERAVTDTISHLGYASESPDSSGNLVRGMLQIAPQAQQIVERFEQIVLFGEAIEESDSPEEITALTSEVVELTRRLVDGDSGREKGHYGLAQLRRDVEAILARETPAYETVGSWYLFNLVQMPNGQWEFATDDVRPGARRY